MPRVKQYIDKDVLTAARERIRHVYDIFDSPVVMFSGGKDSSCVLLLAKEVHEERGLGPVEAIFGDEEFLPTENIAMLEEVRKLPWVNLRWTCLPRYDEKFILGSFSQYIRWDPNREHHRPIPEWAETEVDFGLEPGSLIGPGTSRNQDELLASKYPGNVAFMTGVRASESLVRFRSVVNKLNENYINKIEGNPNSRVRMVKPIYDWMENDVLKFIYESDFPLCEYYDAQEMSRSSLRIGPPTAAAAKKLDRLKESDPELYQAVITSFPEMALNDMYWSEYDMDKALEPYMGDGFRGVMRYIQENIPKGPLRDRAVKRYRMYLAMHENRPEEFPASHLLKQTAAGARERKVRGIDMRAVKKK